MIATPNRKAFGRRAQRQQNPEQSGADDETGDAEKKRGDGKETEWHGFAGVS
jgi:hypothetical protein